MAPTRTVFALGLLLAASGPAISCGGDDDPAAPECPLPACPVDVSGLDLTTPSVSFETEVLPLFRRSCTFSSCHGSPTDGKAKLYLGPKKSDTGTTIDSAFRQQLIDGLVDVASQTAPEMDLVEAGDPDKSFLMLKVDGCHNEAGLTCKTQTGSKSKKPCGDVMPQNGVLCAEDRDLLRRWIAQGAQND